MYKRKTTDIYNIMGRSEYGKEIYTNCSTLKEARQNLKDYQENDKTAFFWIEKHRQKKQ